MTTGSAREPGAPFSLPTEAGQKREEIVISEMGDVDKFDGCRISIIGDSMCFHCCMGGSEVEIGVSVTSILEAIQEMGHLVGS